MRSSRVTWMEGIYIFRFCKLYSEEPLNSQNIGQNFVLILQADLFKITYHNVWINLSCLVGVLCMRQTWSSFEIFGAKAESCDLWLWRGGQVPAYCQRVIQSSRLRLSDSDTNIIWHHFCNTLKSDTNCIYLSSWDFIPYLHLKKVG